MHDQQSARPPLPDHPELREVALAIEEAGLSGEILDRDWKIVFVSSSEARIVGMSPDRVAETYGKSLVVRNSENPEHYAISEEDGREWWRRQVPIMRHFLAPGTPEFDEVFGATALAAQKTAPIDPPRAWASSYSFADSDVDRLFDADVMFVDVILNDASGDFIGVMRLAGLPISASLLARLGRGDVEMFERMDRVARPARRAASILFADLEGSGDLSRRLSSGAYFELIRGMVDLIDSEVIRERGIVGKHAGDGASALFLVEDFSDESGAATAAINAGRAIRDAAASLSDAVDVNVNVGLHWGATLMVGQVSTSGRLEVTALGDEMNEAARIEGAATKGSVFASKNLVERLSVSDAATIGINPDAMVYTPLNEIDGVGAKAIRDAGAIAVTTL